MGVGSVFSDTSMKSGSLGQWQDLVKTTGAMPEKLLWLWWGKA
jgi:hypothetical protein